MPNPLPSPIVSSRARLNEFTLTTPDGLSLHGREWAAAKPRAVVGLVHGLGEHGGRYDHVGDCFAEHGVALLSTDLRGHGLSEGRRGHAKSYDLLMGDISQLLETARLRHPNLPCFLYGHSLGGNLALNHIVENKPKLAGAIITAPLLRLAFAPPAWQTRLLKLMKRGGLEIAMPSGLDDKELSRDLNVVRAYRNDPLTHDRVSPSLAVDMVDHGERLLKRAGEIDTPLLLIHGAEDQITSPAATAEFVENLKSEHVFKLWEGLRHEPHNEPERKAVLSFMLRWLDDHS